MRWIVEGADKETGKDRITSVTADDKAQAESAALSQGILASRVTHDDTIQPPDYAGLQIGKSIIGIFAALYYGLAVLSLFAAISITADQSAAHEFTAVQMFIIALTCGMIGGLLHAVSAGCVALRDIARNSWR